MDAGHLRVQSREVTRVGAAIGAGNPKNVAVGIAAAAAISSAGLQIGQTVVAVVSYVIVAGMGVAAPFVVTVMLREEGSEHPRRMEELAQPQQRDGDCRSLPSLRRGARRSGDRRPLSSPSDADKVMAAVPHHRICLTSRRGFEHSPITSGADIRPATPTLKSAQLGLASRVTPGQEPRRGSNIVPSPPLVDIFTTFALVDGHVWLRFANQVKPSDVVQTPAFLDPRADGENTCEACPNLRAKPYRCPISFQQCSVRGQEPGPCRPLQTRSPSP